MHVACSFAARPSTAPRHVARSVILGAITAAAVAALAALAGPAAPAHADDPLPEMAFVANAFDFPDALAAAAVAGSVGGPVVLTPANGLDANAEQALADSDPELVVVVGGTAVLSDAVTADVAALGYDVERVAGTQRTATAAALAAFAEQQGFDRPVVTGREVAAGTVPGLNAELLQGLAPGDFGGGSADTDRLDALEARLDDLETENAALEASVDELEATLAGVSRSDVDGHDTLRLSGMNLQVVNGTDRTDGTPDGLGNLIVGHNAPRSGTTDADRQGSHYLVVGDEHHWTSYGGLVAGLRNTASGPAATVVGGYSNTASGTRASVSGGASNTADATSASVSGGQLNTTTGAYASVSGGRSNEAIGWRAWVGGGLNNVASGPIATVSGGSANSAESAYTSVSGGLTNAARDNYASVSGGEDNVASGEAASVSGGRGGTASGGTASVSGGEANTASGFHTSVSGGLDNEAAEVGASILGGLLNHADGGFAAVNGGVGNTASGDSAAVLGGDGVTVTANRSCHPGC